MSPSPHSPRKDRSACALLAQRNRLRVVALSMALGFCALVIFGSQTALSQSTNTLPFTYTIGSESSNLSYLAPNYMDNNLNLLYVNGNTYLVGLSSANWSAWSICEGTTLDNIGCPWNGGGYYASSPTFNDGAAGWPSLGGTLQGGYWPDGIYADSSGTWYTAVHVEYNYNNESVVNEAHFRGIGIATSTDQGKDWTWQGWIVKSSNPTGSVNQFPGMYYDYGPGDCELTLGNDGYLYLFYGEAWVRKGDFIRYLVNRVARAPVGNLLPNPSTGASPWMKWYGNSWTTQNGIGGLGSDLFFGTTTGLVAYDSTLGQYIMIANTAETLPTADLVSPNSGGAETIAITTGTGGLGAEAWTPQTAIYDTSDADPQLWYGALVNPSTYSTSSLGQSFRQYVMADGGTTYPSDNAAQYYTFSIGSGSTTGDIFNYPYPLEPVNDGGAPYRGIDLAAGITPIASSNNGDAPSNATDGNLNTAWIAGSGTMSLTSPQTLSVNLGQQFPLGSVMQVWNENDNSTFQYQIRASNDPNCYSGSEGNLCWVALADRSAGVQQSTSLNPASPLVANMNLTDGTSANAHNGDVTLDNVYGSWQYVQLAVDGISNGHWASSVQFSVYAADNIALGAYASSNPSSTIPPNNAIDHNTGTAWVASSGSFPQQLIVNLGACQPIGTVVQRFNETDPTNIYQFAIKGSTDGSTWATLADYTENGVSGPVIASPVTTGGCYQYIDLYVTNINNAHWASSSELEIYYPSYGPIVSGKNYRIVNLNSGRNLEIPGGGGIGVQAEQAAAQCSNGQAYCSYQEWQATYEGNNEWTFTNLNNQDALEINGSNSQVDTWGYVSGATNELWTLQSSGSGTYMIQSVSNNDYLAVYQAQTGDGAPIIPFPVGFTPNEEWTFVPID
jgi:hypothetical protein